jgi:5-methylcytosine-specific restriction enzyme subunit McrC
VQIIELEEEVATQIPECDLDDGWAMDLHRQYGSQVQIEFPSIQNERHYILRPRGYVGHILLGDRLLDIKAKVGVNNLFGMLEYAYQLAIIESSNRLVGCRSVAELFERLAAILANKVLARIHKGVRRDYVEVEAETTYLRGRLLINRQDGQGGYWPFKCRYQDHTAEILDNHILAWTLYCLGRLQLQRDEVRRQIRQAFRAMASVVEPKEVEIEQCLRPVYNSLNADYRPMHALCRFFLEHCGPALGKGGGQLMPVVVNMPLLFERFVAEWLSEHLPDGLQVSRQYHARLEGDERLSFQIDIVLMDKQTKQPLAVLDTKYTRSAQPKEEDIQQVVAYAVRMGTKQAFIVYPWLETKPLYIKIGAIEVRSLVFDINRDLPEAGELFIDELMEICI